jgi:predicted dehydrogenase/nucleoside-diphosphate-sugar epimerase
MATHHVAAIGRNGTAKVVGVYDRAADRAEELAAVADTYTYPSLDRLITEASPDVIHVCTPPSTHFETAYAALNAGIHVYVEKPFALSVAHASALLDTAAAKGCLVCSGHQLLCDPAFESLMDGASRLGEIVQVDSHFAFRPVGSAARSSAALARQAVDILPHPLYSLVAAMERFSPREGPVELAWAEAGPADVHAMLRRGPVMGRLSVSLRARPVASTLAIVGAKGSLTADFVRSIVFGAANPGTDALEKILNPMVEGLQLVTRTTRSLAHRLRSGISYPGLAELIGRFHQAVASAATSPVSPEHLLRVTSIFEELVSRIDRASRPSTAVTRPRVNRDLAPRIALTGANGFLGAEIARALGRVRGIGRGAAPDDEHACEWISADLSQHISSDAFKGIEVVIHAAAETNGGYDAHQRNTIDGTRQLLRAMREAGVRRLVLVSSLSVLRPPRTWREQQDEDTPRPRDPRPYGPYAWGKTHQEALVEREAAALGIATRVIRPGALIDWRDPSLPGIMGRHLYGRWHLGLGRSSLPIAICDVRTCADAIAWCAIHFDDAPAVVNLFDPAVPTRGVLINRLRQGGWNGRMIWVPISAIAAGLMAARAAMSLTRGRWPDRFAAWSILRPRHYDGRRTAALLAAAERRQASAVPASQAIHA